jgi:predicted HTH domain antitoxin
MKTVTVTLPDDIDFDQAEILKMIASKLYERGTLSLGQAANLVGMPKWDFAEILADYGVSIINYPASEVARDLENA